MCGRLSDAVDTPALFENSRGDNPKPDCDVKTLLSVGGDLPGQQWPRVQFLFKLRHGVSQANTPQHRWNRICVRYWSRHCAGDAKGVFEVADPPRWKNKRPDQSEINIDYLTERGLDKLDKHLTKGANISAVTAWHAGRIRLNS